MRLSMTVTDCTTPPAAPLSGATPIQLHVSADQLYAAVRRPTVDADSLALEDAADLFAAQLAAVVRGPAIQLHIL
jgi:hypothetical protein